MVGYEGYYQVSSTGLVRSLNEGRYFMKVLSPYSGNNHGYQSVSLWVPDRRTHLVHRLVAQAFIPNPENLPEVNHKDGNDQNNQVENLEWCTAKENTQHGIAMGLIQVSGENNGMAKLTQAQVDAIRSRYKRESYHKSNAAELCQEFGISRPGLSAILNRKRWG